MEEGHGNAALDGPVPLLRGCHAAYLDLGSNRGLKIEQLLEACSCLRLLCPLPRRLHLHLCIHPSLPHTHPSHPPAHPTSCVAHASRPSTHSPLQARAGGFLRLFPPAYRGAKDRPCALGAEPNPSHAAHLRTVEDAQRAAGRRVTILNVAVSNANGDATFWSDLDYQAHDHMCISACTC